jgi:hypothetical protein
MPEEKTLTPEEIAQQRKEAEEKKINPIQPATNLTTEAKALGRPDTVNMVEKAYESPISQLGLTIKGLEGRKSYIQQQDEVAQRRSRNMQMIAGLSDGLASLANLIGVADRGSNIDLGEGALTPLAKRAEAARLERKADIKSIDDRLDQAQTQLLQMKLARGNAIAGAQAKEQERQDKLAAERRGYAFQEKMLDKKLDNSKELAELKFKQTLFTNAANNKAKKELEAFRQAQANARARYKAGTTGSNATTLTILKGDDGQFYSYDLTKAEKAAIEEKFSEAIKQDLADPNNTALSALYAEYETVLKNASLGIGTANKQEVEDLRNELIGMSPTLSGMIKKGRKGTLVPMGVVEPDSDDEELDDVDALLNNNAVN